MASHNRKRLFLGLGDAGGEATSGGADGGTGAAGAGCGGPLSGSGGCTPSTLVRAARLGGFAPLRARAHTGAVHVTASNQATLSSTTATPSASHVAPPHL
jgi:hypothetical protein